MLVSSSWEWLFSQENVVKGLIILLIGSTILIQQVIMTFPERAFWALAGIVGIMIVIAPNRIVRTADGPTGDTPMEEAQTEDVPG